MTHSAQPTADAMARDQVFCSLTPLFLEAANGDPIAARAAAEAMLAGYAIETTEQLQLAAQIAVFSLAALDSLRRSITDADLPVNVHLRLRGNANAMNRSAEKCRKALHLRRQPTTDPQAAAAPAPIADADIKAAVLKASEVIAHARSDLRHGGKPMSYTQRLQENERLKRLAKRHARLANTQPTQADVMAPAAV